MISHSMDIWHGLIVCSRGLESRQSVLIVHGFTHLSRSIKKDSIRIVTSSRRIALTMQFPLERGNRNISIPRSHIFQLNTIHYRVKLLRSPVVSVGLDGSMTYHKLPVLRLALGTWQSICLKRQSLRRYGLKGGGV